MNSLYEILPYSIDVVAACINNFTDTPISIIKRKAFINYLDSYLAPWKAKGDKNISFLIENDYIDFSFLQDYSNYYVKCFNQYPRNCIRLHFFSLDETQLGKIYDYSKKKDDNCLEIIKTNYLGFIVIRPIPSTFIARACLKKYETENTPKHCLISKKILSHILGIQLFVDTIPFIEQDKVLSVCATSALWSFFNAHKQIDYHRIPSPYEITSLAINNDDSKSIVLLNEGLTIQMMCNCIKSYGLVPLNYELHKEAPLFFYELIHVMVSSGYPVIIGLSVYSNKPTDNDEKNKQIFEGLHAVVALGDETSNALHFVATEGKIKTFAQNISKLYIHDDRIGPYAKIQYEDNSWKLELLKTTSSVQPKTEYYVPSEIVIGIYQKIRLPFATIWNFTFYLNNDLLNLINKHENTPEEVINLFESLVWDFKFEECSSLKNRIRFSDISNDEKEKVMNLSLPLYCWIIKAYFTNQMELGFEIIIDATDISQGNFIIDIIYYDEMFFNILQDLKQYYLAWIKKDGGSAFSDLIQHSLWPLYKYFTKTNDVFSNLDYLYGKIKIPKYIKPFELKNDEIRKQEPFIITCKHDAEIIKLDKNQKYIWVIDKDGFLIIGKEDDNPDSDNKGHPTLLQGRAGRIAGELRFKENKWFVNKKSGRYSYPIEYSDLEADIYVKNVIHEKFEVYFNEEFEFENI